MKGLKTGGREKGSQNKVTQERQEGIYTAIHGQIYELGEVLDNLKRDNPLEWAKLIIKLMDFVLPKKLDVTSSGKIITVIPPTK